MRPRRHFVIAAGLLLAGALDEAASAQASLPGLDAIERTSTRLLTGARDLFRAPDAEPVRTPERTEESESSRRKATAGAPLEIVPLKPGVVVVTGDPVIFAVKRSTKPGNQPPAPRSAPPAPVRSDAPSPAPPLRPGSAPAQTAPAPPVPTAVAAPDPRFPELLPATMLERMPRLPLLPPPPLPRIDRDASAVVDWLRRAAEQTRPVAPPAGP
jgi:hypothetical protein